MERKYPNEVVVCIKKDELHHIAGITGILKSAAGVKIEDVFQNQAKLLRFNPLVVSEVKHVQRDEAEVSADLLHLISYAMIVDPVTGKVLTYQRGSKGSETRLVKRSLGFGGHVTAANYEEDPETLGVVPGMVAELQEELGIDPEIIKYQLRDMYVRPNKLGHLDRKGQVIYDPCEEVGKTHLGVHAVLFVTSDQIGAAESGMIEDLQWVDIVDLLDKDQYETYESWSKTLIDNVLRGSVRANSALRVLNGYSKTFAEISEELSTDADKLAYAEVQDAIPEHVRETLSERDICMIGYGASIANGQQSREIFVNKSFTKHPQYSTVINEITVAYIEHFFRDVERFFEVETNIANARISEAETLLSHVDQLLMAEEELAKEQGDCADLDRSVTKYLTLIKERLLGMIPQQTEVEEETAEFPVEEESES